MMRVRQLKFYLTLFALGGAFFVSSIPALSGVSSGENPIWPLSCELVLKSGIQKQNRPVMILSTLRHLRAEVASKNHISINLGGGFDPFQFQGSIQKMGSDVGKKVISRINILENQINQSQLDVQYVVSEIRGADNIKAAFHSIQENEETLVRVYGEEAQRRTGVLERSLSHAKKALLVGFALAFEEYFVKRLGLMSSDFALDLLVANMMAFVPWNIATTLDRTGVRDSSYLEFKKVLSDVEGLKDLDKVYVTSNSIVLPIEVHRFLMSDLERSKDPRVEAVHEQIYDKFQRPLGPRLFSHFWGGSVDTNAMRAVQNAGDTSRFTYVDHFIYWDRSQNEPVWFMAYSSYRQRPAGRKPPRKSDELDDKEYKPFISPELEPIRIPIDHR